MRMRVRRVGVLVLALVSSGIQVAPDIPGVILAFSPVRSSV